MNAELVLVIRLECDPATGEPVSIPEVVPFWSVPEFAVLAGPFQHPTEGWAALRSLMDMEGNAYA